MNPIFNSITTRTNKLFDIMSIYLERTDDCYRFCIGVDCNKRPILGDIKEDTTIYGNREIQKFCKSKIEELKKTAPEIDIKRAEAMAYVYDVGFEHDSLDWIVEVPYTKYNKL